MKTTLSFSLMVLIALSLSCSNKQMRNFNAIPSFSSDYVNAIIEIPAGTNKKVEYHIDKKMFLIDQVDGKERMIDFLPCPGNYGFIPGTYLDPLIGGDGDPIDVLVISESLPTGTLMEVIPLWILYFDDQSPYADSRESDPKIIAVPADPKQRVIQATSYEELHENYPVVVEIIEKWFRHYKGDGVMEIRAWGDGDMAIQEIEKWQLYR